MAVLIDQEDGKGSQQDAQQRLKRPYFKVVHRSPVAVYETPTLASAATGFKSPGIVVKVTQKRHGWIQLATREGWMLLEHPTEGPFMEELKPACFKVVHKAVLVRKDADTSSGVLQIKREGEYLDIQGHLEGWVKVTMGDEMSSGWSLISHSTYGKLLEYVDGEVPTFIDETTCEGSITSTPSGVYTGKVTDPVTEHIKNDLEKLRGEVLKKEYEMSESNDSLNKNFEVMRRGLMANAGQSTSSGFCIGGDPL